MPPKSAAGNLAILLLALAVAFAASAQQRAVPPAGSWQQPAAALAVQVADLLGPGQARLTLRNQSSIASSELPAIRRQIEAALKARGVTLAGAESASQLRITLSENAHERLWVAEIIEGDRAQLVPQVVMVPLPAPDAAQPAPAGALVLRAQPIVTASNPILAVLEGGGWLVALEPQRLVLYTPSAGAWQEQRHLDLDPPRLSRDPRGELVPGSDAGPRFLVYTGGLRCESAFNPGGLDTPLTAACAASDDPWPLPAPPGAATIPKAFYNPARNAFTGVVTPSSGPDLPPFYTAALLPRASGATALLIGGIDGKLQLVESGRLLPVSGARDWGSDFAVLQASCAAAGTSPVGTSPAGTSVAGTSSAGPETVLVAAASGPAAQDSLRAYSLPALEAVPASAPFALPGSVTALWPAPGARSLYAVLRTPDNRYEVDRVTASCN